MPPVLLVEVISANFEQIQRPQIEPESPRNAKGAWRSVYARAIFSGQEYSTIKHRSLDRPQWAGSVHEFSTGAASSSSEDAASRRLDVHVFDTGPFQQDQLIGHCAIELDQLWRPDGSGVQGALDRWFALEAPPLAGEERSDAYCGEVRIAARLVESSKERTIADEPRVWLGRNGDVVAFDEYGGALEPLPAVSALYRCFRSHATILEERAQDRWVSFISQLTYDHELCESSQYAHVLYGGEEALETWANEPRTHKITELVRGGVPASLRSKLWPLLAGATMLETKVTAMQPDYYQGLVRRFKAQAPSLAAHAAVGAQQQQQQQQQQQHEGEGEKANKPTRRLDGVGQQIDTDLHRTFAQDNNSVNTPQGRQMIRRVLGAHAAHNRSVGYCQSMNYVVAHLLMFLEESDAFWVLASVVENILTGYYSSNMAGVQTDLKIMKRLLHERRPDISEKLEGLGIPVELVCSKWLLCMFGVRLSSSYKRNLALFLDCSYQRVC